MRIIDVSAITNHSIEMNILDYIYLKCNICKLHCIKLLICSVLITIKHTKSNIKLTNN